MTVLWYELVCFTSLFYVWSVLTARSRCLSIRYRWTGFPPKAPLPRHAIQPLWPSSDPASFPKLVYHPHMGRISISRKEGEVLLSRQLRFSQWKRDPISSTELTSDSICQQAAPPPDTRALRPSRGCQLCSQTLPLAAPVFLKLFFFFNVGCHGSFPVHFGVGLANKAAPRGGGSLDVWGLQTGL